MSCSLCKRPLPKHFGNPRKCAFENQVFSSDNWNCGTASALRELVSGCSFFHSEDQYLGVVPLLHGRFMLVSWYKSRGGTEGIWMVDGDEMEPISYFDAVEILGHKLLDVSQPSRPTAPPISQMGG